MSADRLFVPLKTKYYRAFENGDKSWEVRGVNPQFNRDTVEVGRMAEIRRGYSTDDSLWGVIERRLVVEDIETIPIAINYRDVDPTAESREAFLSTIRDMLDGYDEYIAFRVRLIEPWAWESIREDAADA